MLHFLSPFPVLYSKKSGGVAVSLVFELQTVALKDSGLCLVKSAFPSYKKIIGTMLLCGSVCVYRIVFCHCHCGQLLYSGLLLYISLP